MSGDRGRVSEFFGVGVAASISESGRERGTLIVARWDADMTDWVSQRLGGDRIGGPGFRQPGPADFDRLGVDPYEVTSDASNLITTGGWDRILSLAIAAGGQAYDATHTRIGVGTATTAAASGQTDLQAVTGSTNRVWVMVTGAGAVGTGTGVRRLSFVGTVGTGDGNFAWQEEGIDNGSASGVGASTPPLLNRVVSNQSTKVSGQTWTATFLLDYV